MARVIKETTTLRRQAHVAWIVVGVTVGITFASFMLYKIPHLSPWLYFLPICFLVLTSAIANPCLIYIRGNKGERQVLRALLKLSDDFLIYNDVIITVAGEKEAQIDHVLVSKFGVWCVETKSHIGKIYGKENDKNWTQVKHSERGRRYSNSIYNPIKQNATHCRRLGQYLNEQLGLKVPIFSVIVFTSADKLQVTATTPVVTQHKLAETIRAECGPPVVTEDTIDKIRGVLPTV